MSAVTIRLTLWYSPQPLSAVDENEVSARLCRFRDEGRKTGWQENNRVHRMRNSQVSSTASCHVLLGSSGIIGKSACDSLGTCVWHVYVWLLSDLVLCFLILQKKMKKITFMWKFSGTIVSSGFSSLGIHSRMVYTIKNTDILCVCVITNRSKMFKCDFELCFANQLVLMLTD